MKKILILLFFGAVLFSQCSKNDITDIINNPNTENNKAVGASANDILSTSKYPSMNIEILYMPGYMPNAAATNQMLDFLNTYINKPDGIFISLKPIPASGKASLTLEEIKEIEQKNRTVFTTTNQIGLCLLYTDGAYSQGNVLGIAYKNTSMAVFGKTIYANSGGLLQVSRATLEAAIYEHELGHLMGLVDIGSPMQTPHKDAANGAHCNNTNCLMYYKSETTDILGILLGGTIPPLDANCRADLRANGGK